MNLNQIILINLILPFLDIAFLNDSYEENMILYGQIGIIISTSLSAISLYRSKYNKSNIYFLFYLFSIPFLLLIMIYSIELLISSSPLQLNILLVQISVTTYTLRNIIYNKNNDF